jgi:hypothetical protein
MLKEHLKKTMVKDVFDVPVPQEDRDFGVEIELEGVRITTNIRGWAEHKEGSLRGEGVEYVTKGAVSEKALRSSMEQLQKTLTGGDRVVYKSQRTSTHIHLNMTRQSLWDVYGYIIAFTAVEPLLIHLAAAERDGNLFCMPSYDTGDMGREFARVLTNDPIRGLSNFRQKYAALNVLPIAQFGTVECRVFPSSIDPDEVCQWAGWLKNIRTHVEGVDNFLQFVNQVRTMPEQLAWAVFDRPLERNHLDLVRWGCEQAYEMARVLYLAGQEPYVEPAPPAKKMTNNDVSTLIKQRRAKEKWDDNINQAVYVVDGKWTYQYNRQLGLWERQE